MWVLQHPIVYFILIEKVSPPTEEKCFCPPGPGCPLLREGGRTRSGAIMGFPLLLNILQSCKLSNYGYIIQSMHKTFLLLTDSLNNTKDINKFVN